MNKVFIMIMFFIFFTGCSVLNIKNKELTNEEKQSLIVLVDNMKKELNNGNIEYMEDKFVSSYRNSKLKEEMKKIDFSRLKVIVSKPQFENLGASNLVGLIYGVDTLYFDVNYIFKNNQWKIASFKEREEK